MMNLIFGIVRFFARRFRSLRRSVQLGLLTSFFGVAVFAAYSGAQYMNYVENDPTFCRSCHTMIKAWDRWSTSEHSKVTCHKCHESSPIDSMEQIVKYTLNKPNEVRKHAVVTDDACEKCHESNDPQWLQIAETAGHKVHVEGQTIACTKCHAVTIHRFAPPADICLACHPDQKVKMTKMATLHCLDCHNYLRENSPLKPTRQTCLDCHEQMQTAVHWPSDAPMRFLCSQCHQPHTQEKPDVQCVACHTNQKSEGLHGGKTHAATACTTCHKPHEWKVNQRDSCTACHSDRTSHNVGTVCQNCHSFKGANPVPPLAPSPAPSGAPSPAPSRSPAAAPKT